MKISKIKDYLENLTILVICLLPVFWGLQFFRPAERPDFETPFFEYVLSCSSDVYKEDVTELFKASYPEHLKLRADLADIFNRHEFRLTGVREGRTVSFYYEGYGGPYCGQHTTVYLKYDRNDLAEVYFGTTYICL